VNAIFNQIVLDPSNPTLGVVGSGLTTGNSFGGSTTFSPGLGSSQANGFANGIGNSTATQAGGVMMPSSAGPEQLYGNGFGDFAASGGGSSVFGSPVAVPGTGGPATPPQFVTPLQTGGSAGGFGFTFAGGLGNASGDVGGSEAFGSASSAGGGSAQGASLFGMAGGNGGGSSFGTGGGIAGLVGGFGNVAFNGNGGGTASGGGGGYVGFNPPTPLI
jgi:hypothetical protein